MTFVKSEASESFLAPDNTPSFALIAGPGQNGSACNSRLSYAIWNVMESQTALHACSCRHTTLAGTILAPDNVSMTAFFSVHSV